MAPARLVIIITDVDGCLLDARYRLGPARAALKRLLRAGVPVVLCTSKTAAEVHALEREIGFRLPAIVESGGAVMVPGGSLPVPGGVPRRHTRDGLLVPLAVGIDAVRAGLAEIGAVMGGEPSVRGLGAMTQVQLRALTGLAPAQMRLARRRQFDEPFVFLRDPRPRAAAIRRVLARRGLTITRGAIMHHLHGRTDKGHATRIVIAWFRHAGFAPVTVGFGDGPHDVALLRAVDHPIIVPRADGAPDPHLRHGVPHAALAPAAGPVGWAAIARRLIP
jgi:mannosyl-3-phosphoglycerate phosphatase